MGKQKAPERLAKFLSYILERRPDEFGLVLDGDGYVKIKELLKAVCEEEGWRHVRRAAIDEILVTLPEPPFEMQDKRIRAKNREHLPRLSPAENPPKLLYVCVRKKAHAFVLEKGISPGSHPYLILSSDRDLAERMGRRSDSSPLMLTVQVSQSSDAGVLFRQAGEKLYLTDFIPPGCFSAPPLPKQKVETKKPEKAQKPEPQKFPGSFFINLDEERDSERKFRKKEKDKIVKERDKRKRRKEKQKMWSE